MFETMLGRNGLCELDGSQRFYRIHIDLEWLVGAGSGGFVENTWDMRIAVRLWMRGLRKPSSW
jgi:hypothetical protein